jgi:hypothetical protein
MHAALIEKSEEVDWVGVITTVAIWYLIVVFTGCAILVKDPMTPLFGILSVILVIGVLVWPRTRTLTFHGIRAACTYRPHRGHAAKVVECLDTYRHDIIQITAFISIVTCLSVVSAWFLHLI